MGRCDPVPTVDHAAANTSSADAGIIVSYTCEYGYKFNYVESPVIYCDGTSWTDMKAYCTGKYCLLNVYSRLTRALRLSKMKAIYVYLKASLKALFSLNPYKPRSSLSRQDVKHF